MIQEKTTTLKNKNGTIVNISNYGGIVKDFIVDGKNIVLGKDNIEDYKNGDAYLGALIGRVGNRIGNGEFVLDEKVYKLPLNDNPNSLHGGDIGFDQYYWDIKEVDNNTLVLSILSPNGDQGYPGNLEIIARYHLDDNDRLTLDFEAVTDEPTPINLTNHSYFNLNGKGSIKDHQLKINSKSITETDENLLPTGNIENIENTALDFTELRPINEGLKNKENKNIKIANGLDHNFIIKKENDDTVNELVTLKGDDLTLKIYSDQPGVQVYTGNFLNEKARDNGFYKAFSGVAIEPQNWPDAINKDTFPNSVLKPGETYKKTIIYEVSKN